MIGAVVARNVHQALPEGAHQVLAYGGRRPSRNGDVVFFPGPFITEYQRPLERVMFWPERDANPYFHFFESLWMLAGRDDVDFPSRFNSQIHQYSDDGKVFHSAYGRRWRVHFGRDQLKIIADNLRKDPNCRRQVLQMWDPECDLSADSKDLPCNTCAYFQRGPDGELNMTVSNRSNDLIWGAYGANAVHFSFLLEYVAALVGCPPGRYWQFSANTHFYVDVHEAMVYALANKATQPPGPAAACPYAEGRVRPFPLTSINLGRWHRDFALFLQHPEDGKFSDPFFEHVAQPLYRSHSVFREDRPDRFTKAKNELGSCHASDWMRACWEWLERREAAWRSKQAS